MKVSGEQITRATEMLRAKYPQERVVLWCDIPPHGEPRYTAGVGEAPNAQYWSEDDPTEAVAKLIRQVGERDPEAIRRQKIAKLREELERLEAQGMAQLITECEQRESELV